MVTRSSRWVFFLSIAITCLARTGFCVGDTIASGESLSPDQTLTSKGNVFELGFFTEPSSNIYVGIWYKNIWETITVWVANRDKPLSNVSSSRLILSEEGNLHLMDSKIQVWSTNLISKPGNSTVAVLLDDGNLVLKDGYKSSGFLWQSFDYPNGVLVPGAKLWFNKLTKASQLITAWKSYEDPGEGMFSLGIDPNGSQLYLEWNKSQRYWTSGPWNGHFFSQLPEMNERRIKEIFNFSFISNENETFFIFSVHDTSILSVLAADVNGELKLYTWLKGVAQKHVYWARPTNKCEIYGLCGAFGSCLGQDTISCACLDGFEPRFQPNQGLHDWYKGCARRTPLQCESKTSDMGQKDDFLMQSNIRLPGNAKPLTVGGDQQCKLACLNNCSCTAYTYANGQCSIWYGELFNLQQLNDSQGSNIYVRLAASELPRPKTKAKKPLQLIIALQTILSMLIFCFFLCYLRKRRLKQRGESETSQDLLLFDLGTSNKASDCNYSDISMLLKGQNQRAKLPLFSFSSVLAATDNFAAANKLGEGGFGPVYKGKLQDGDEVAVKRLSKQSGQGLTEFRNEMLLISQLQHRNLVGLLGCCVERDEKILIYEYMPNKSLDSILFVQKNVTDPTQQRLLDWERRIHIILGIAQGLIYLHEYSRLRIIHRDLKASNILLDGDMNPKISDFGMARIFGGNNSQGNTNRIVGTYGYMSPEYAMNGVFSIKSDVFSFGVLMLEILSGKKNSGFCHPDSLHLLEYAWELWKIGRGLDLIDPSLSDPPLMPLTLRYFQVALLCVQESPNDRPTMPEVFSMFSNESATVPLPRKPAFLITRRNSDPNSRRSVPSNFSVNTVTISMEAR